MSWADAEKYAKSLCTDRLMMVRSKKPSALEPYAVVRVGNHENSRLVAENLDATILEFWYNWDWKTVDRLELERDRLNTIARVMLS